MAGVAPADRVDGEAVVRDLELVALTLAILWLVLLAAVFAVVFVESWVALWRRLDRLAATRRRWWGPS